jgi:hypothetical protein
VAGSTEEPDAVGIGGGGLPIAHTRLADGDRADTGHHLALRQVTVADDALVAVRGLQIGMLAEKVRDLGLDCLGQQRPCPITQDFGELVVDVSKRRQPIVQGNPHARLTASWLRRARPQ